MAYGSLKVDNIIFTNGGVDQTITVSGIVAATSGNLTVTGTISGDVVQGGTLVSGATVTGGIGQFTTLTGGTAGFTTVTGTTVTGTTAQFTSITGGGIGATTITGTTVSGTTANFASGVFTTQISGATVTGTTASFTSGNFTNISGGTHTITSGVFASGSVTNPSISFVGDSNTGIYASAADQVSITTNGTERVRVDATGQIEAVSLGSATAPTYSFTTDPNTGIFSPGADQVAISTNGTGQLFVDASGNVGLGASPTYQLDLNRTGSPVFRVTNGTTACYMQPESGSACARIGSLSNHPLAFAINGSEVSRFDTSGRLGLGTSSPASTLHVQHPAQTTGYWEGKGLLIHEDATANQGIAFYSRNNSEQYIASLIDNAESYLIIGARKSSPTDSVDAITIRGDGKVGIGTTSPSGPLEVAVAANRNLLVAGVDNEYTRLGAIQGGTSNNRNLNLTGESLLFSTGLSSGTSFSERARIDSSGRLLVGTSSALGTNSNSLAVTAHYQLAGTTTSTAAASLFRYSANTGGSVLVFNKSRNATVGNHTVVASGDTFGLLSFSGSDGSAFIEGAQIKAEVDGTPGADDMPGRLVFSTTRDGQASPSEAMRINASQQVLVNGTTPDSGNEVMFVRAPSSRTGIHIDVEHGSPGFTGIIVDRTAADGDLISFLQAGALEGVISVSGTTVTYGGGHLARWSQLLNNEDPSEILKGTVMSNLDEMCEWGKEDNEQLNKVKVSNVKGDPNVAGVFVSTSFSDDGPLDFFVAMTGDMIIRIAEGVTVQRGDLLMSAGDGTAKPQDDDIIRSKTIAKVTSTHITCTYDDGSYCVPCVLMAC